MSALARRYSLVLFVLFWLGAADASDVRLPDATRVELPNGVVLILIEKHEVPLVAVQAMLRGGAVTDPPGKGGLASLFAALLQKGAAERDAAAFSEAVDSAGGVLSAAAGLESITIEGEFLARDSALMIELLADMLQRPALDAAELDKLRERSINLIRAAKDSDPGNVMPTYANAFLFGAHPYGNPVDGSESSLARISHQDVADYFAGQVGADRLVIAVAGDFEIAEMLAMLRVAFTNWRGAGADLAETPDPSMQAGGRVLLIDKPGATQTYFWIGNVGVARNYAKRADLDIANTVFGGRFTSMLNTALRIDSGLTYGASSQLRRLSKPGSVAISSFTRTDATVEAIDMALGVLGQFEDAGVAAEMIASARNYVLGQFPTSLETSAQLAAEFAELEFFGLGDDFVNDYAADLKAVDVASVKDVIASVYPPRDKLVFVVLGDASLIRDAVQKYGAVTELSITAPHFRVE
ncbi:MAG TPA: pitrilysin family protein [Woeseiaceae bacterium]|nr:pitrilysin family protein [Woeseiaceae bacterium]